MSRAFAIAALLALTGCAVGPNYTRPSAPISPTYKEAAGWSPAAPADILDRGDWWTLFGDPVLNGLAARVKVSNQNVAAAEASYRQARAVVAEQRGALLPAVNLTGSGTRSGGGSGSGALIVNSDGSTTGGGSGQSARSTYRASLGVSWEIDVWGRIRRTVEAARADAAASEADLAAATLSAQGELAVDYFNLRQAETEIALDQATVNGYQRTTDITQNRFNAGIVAHSDLLQAETQLSTAQSQLEASRQQRAVYEHAIAVLVGEAPGAFSVAPVVTPLPSPPQIPAGLPSTLVQRRPDVASSERRVAAANARIGVARAAYFPDLTLNSSYGFAASVLDSLLSASDSLWSYGLSGAETVFNGGARIAQNKAADAAYDQAVAQYRQTVLTALQEVDDQLVGSAVLERQYTLRRQAADSADAAERMLINQYQAGQVSFIEVVAAQAAAYTARQALALTQTQRLTTSVALIQALGGGWRQAP